MYWHNSRGHPVHWVHGLERCFIWFWFSFQLWLNKRSLCACKSLVSNAKSQYNFPFTTLYDLAFGKCCSCSVWMPSQNQHDFVSGLSSVMMNGGSPEEGPGVSIPALRLWHWESDLSHITWVACLSCCLTKWGSSPSKCTFAQTVAMGTAGFGIFGVTEFILKMSLFYNKNMVLL